MKQVPHHHPITARSATFIAGRLVHPGETVMVDMPDSAQMVDAAPAAPPADTNALSDMLKASIKDILPQLADFNVEQLREVVALEQASAAPRTTLIAELEEAILLIETDPGLKN